MDQNQRWPSLGCLFSLVLIYLIFASLVQYAYPNRSFSPAAYAAAPTIALVIVVISWICGFVSLYPGFVVASGLQRTWKVVVTEMNRPGWEACNDEDDDEFVVQEKSWHEMNYLERCYEDPAFDEFGDRDPSDYP